MSHSFFIYQTRDELLRIHVPNIVYFEGDGNYTTLMSVNKIKSTLAINLTQTEHHLAESLKKNASQFMRVGKRFIINIDYIYSINTLRRFVILSDGRTFAFRMEVSKEAVKKIRDTVLMLYGQKLADKNR